MGLSVGFTEAQLSCDLNNHNMLSGEMTRDETILKVLYILTVMFFIPSSFDVDQCRFFLLSMTQVTDVGDLGDHQPRGQRGCRRSHGQRCLRNTQGQSYDGWRLTYHGYDFLALRVSCLRTEF